MKNELLKLDQLAYSKYIQKIECFQIKEKLIFTKCLNPEVSIIISAYNQYEYTLRCLNSIYCFVKDLDYEIILIDDASSDATCHIEDNIENINVIHNQSNQGYIHSCNKGVSVARGQYLLLLNNDTMLINDAVTPLRNYLKENNRVAAVGSKIIMSNGKIQNSGCKIFNGNQVCQIGNGQNPLLPSFNSIDDTIDFLCGASIMVPKKIWNDVGGYDSIYGFGYAEDVDICFKIKHLGFDIAYIPQSEIVHFGSRSFVKKKEEYIKNNMLLFKEKWGYIPRISRKLALWGTGNIFREFYNEKWDVSFIIDNNSELWGKEINGIRIDSPERIKREKGLNIIICTNYYKDIVSQIVQMNITDINIYIPQMIMQEITPSLYNIGFALFYEDALLFSYIEYYRKKRIHHYIDIGANHPVFGNASIKFYLNGATGCLVEPNKEYEDLLSMLRPKDKVMICGCGSDDGEMAYYEIEGIDTRNTFSESVAQDYINNGYNVKEQKLPVYSLSHIIDDYGKTIDYISIDVEGLEYEILHFFDFNKYKVQYFNVEKNNEEIIILLEKNGYGLIAETPSNCLFERKSEL